MYPKGMRLASPWFPRCPNPCETDGPRSTGGVLGSQDNRVPTTDKVCCMVSKSQKPHIGLVRLRVVLKSTPKATARTRITARAGHQLLM
jgi:hypothetical protein